MKRIRYLVGLALLLRNWPEIFSIVARRINRPAVFAFRNGITLAFTQWIQVEEIIGTWIRKDYGRMPERTTAIDIGASIGSFTLYAAQQGAHVVAYEPDAELFSVLRRNVNGNKLGGSIRAYPFGVAGERGTRTFTVSSLSPLSSLYGTNGKQIEIQCVRLQDIFEENKIDRCDILKLDCEGAEYEILYQAPPECLARIRGIRMEYHVREGQADEPEKLFVFLAQRGFKQIFRRADAPTSGIAWFQNDKTA